MKLHQVNGRILEDIADLLEPYTDATTYLSLESYPTISALGPLFTEIRSKLQKLEYTDTVSDDPALITCYSTHLISSNNIC